MNQMQEAVIFFPKHKFYDGIESCFECASACWICADASLHEADSERLRQCIGLCLLTAEVCAKTARMLNQESNNQELRGQLKECISATERCMEECLKHSDRHEHCLIAAMTSEMCKNICASYLQEYEVA